MNSDTRPDQAFGRTLFPLIDLNPRYVVTAGDLRTPTIKESHKPLINPERSRLDSLFKLAVKGRMNFLG
ncbi:MAG: hypothetical protein CMI17_08560 [Opitutaceae bacterium]|nr:hypothetical protein [Opitutaceae bacterium]